jgi:hypothetical protein
MIIAANIGETGTAAVSKPDSPLSAAEDSQLINSHIAIWHFLSVCIVAPSLQTTKNPIYAQ